MFPGAADLPRDQVIADVMRATGIPDRPTAALLVAIELGESDGDVVVLDKDCRATRPATCDEVSADGG